MNKVVLQVPIDSTLRKKAEKVAMSQGFSSVQEIIRVFLKNLAANSVEVGFYNSDITMSEKAEKRYTAMLKDIEKDKNITSSSSIKLINLHK